MIRTLEWEPNLPEYVAEGQDKTMMQFRHMGLGAM